MARPTTTFLDEIVLAFRGCYALLIGNRQAPSYFDFSQKGLVGSLIGVLLAIALSAFGPRLVGLSMPPGLATQSVVVNVAMFLAQAGTAFLALRQMGRQDGFLPYLVASNWITLVTGVLLFLSQVLGGLGIVIILLIVVLAVASFVNIGRYIVTLTWVQIALLFVSQLVGVLLAAAIVAMVVGLPAA